MTRWIYLPNRGAFAVTTDAMVNPLDETELEPEELLIRESAQNSIDERLEDTEGPVVFRIEKKPHHLKLG